MKKNAKTAKMGQWHRPLVVFYNERSNVSPDIGQGGL